MADVRQTLIYKRLLPCIRKQDRAEFTRMLQLAAAGRFNPDSRHLSGAFVWNMSPQGGDYWYELYTRLRAAGFTEVA